MVWVNGKTFLQGAKKSDNFAMPREKPAHEVRVDGFFIDATEVTNKQFKQFIDATKYCSCNKSAKALHTTFTEDLKTYQLDPKYKDIIDKFLNLQ